jgi:hypothetical protein
MTRTTKRKVRTAMVHNPNRGLSIGGRTSVRKPAARRKNPVRKTVTAKANPFKRRRVARRNNPSTASGLLVAAVMAGVGVSLFDVIATKVIPQTSPLVRVGVKFGGAWFFQSSLGSKIPVLGKHKNDIALVLAVAGAVDLMKLYVLPLVSSAVGNLTGGNVLLLAPQAQVGSGDGTTGNIYGNAWPQTSQQYS